ncbi:hypothetical protein V6N11_026744 [Hibiscus sabdariffa]|uniref:Uncharacterized protein n=1 Tax=Hibiscus sabdariffa TaxID=183260 RepID=A0ABR2SWK5_9ROSI
MMKSELPKQRSSLLVPCVQELAKKPLKQVPPRYVRTDEDSPIVSHTNPSPQVPVLDMAEVFFPRGTEEVASCMQRMGFLPGCFARSESLITEQTSDRLDISWSLHVSLNW